MLTVARSPLISSVRQSSSPPLIDAINVDELSIYVDAGYVTQLVRPPASNDASTTAVVDVLPSVVPESILVLDTRTGQLQDSRLITSSNDDLRSASGASSSCKLFIPSARVFQNASTTVAASPRVSVGSPSWMNEDDDDHDNNSDPDDVAEEQDQEPNVLVSFVASALSWHPSLTIILHRARERTRSAAACSPSPNNEEEDDGRVIAQVAVSGTLENTGVPLSVGALTLVAGALNKDAGGGGTAARAIAYEAAESTQTRAAGAARKVVARSSGQSSQLPGNSEMEDYTGYPLGSGLVLDNTSVQLDTFRVPAQKVYVARTEGGDRQATFGYLFVTPNYVPAATAQVYWRNSDRAASASASSSSSLIPSGSTRLEEHHPNDEVEVLLGKTSRVQLDIVVERQDVYAPKKVIVEIDDGQTQPYPRGQEDDDDLSNQSNRANDGELLRQLDDRREDVVDYTVTDIVAKITNRSASQAPLILKHRLGEDKLIGITCQSFRRRNGFLEFLIALPPGRVTTWRCSLKTKPSASF